MFIDHLSYRVVRPLGSLASIIGSYYAMGQKIKRWERVKLAYEPV
jgi:bisphosphoglycerate-independent phosphoglycerate mutase (AlkP superfamily)